MEGLAILAYLVPSSTRVLGGKKDPSSVPFAQRIILRCPFLSLHLLNSYATSRARSSSPLVWGAWLNAFFSEPPAHFPRLVLESAWTEQTLTEPTLCARPHVLRETDKMQISATKKPRK